MKRLQIGLLVMAAALALSASAGPARAGDSAAIALDARAVRVSECSLGNLAADAARKALQAEVALVQANQFRETTIAAGAVTCDSLKAALLYPDERLVLVELSGARLLAALERGVSALDRPSTGFLQVSGMAVTFRSQEPPGGRIESVTVGRAPLAPEKTYRTAMPASLAKGALGYFRIFNGLEVKATGPPIGDAVCSYLGSSPEMPPRVGQRLRDLTPPAK